MSNEVVQRSDKSNVKLLWRFISPDRKIFWLAFSVILVNLVITAIAPYALELALKYIEDSMKNDLPFPPQIFVRIRAYD